MRLWGGVCPSFLMLPSRSVSNQKCSPLLSPVLIWLGSTSAQGCQVYCSSLSELAIRLQLLHRVMDPAHGSYYSAGGNSSGLANESPYQQNQATAVPVKPLEDSHFTRISERLEADVQNKEWTNRPRHWFILSQINRLDVMDAFIQQGLNDTSLPYKGRSSLPQSLNFFEAKDFLKWQDSVISDVIHLEKGKHVRISNGDVLFESSRKTLGVGSQG